MLPSTAMCTNSSPVNLCPPSVYGTPLFALSLPPSLPTWNISNAHRRMDRMALTAAIPLLAINTFLIGRVPPTCSTYSSTVVKFPRGERGPLVLLLDMGGAPGMLLLLLPHTPTHTTTCNHHPLCLSFPCARAGGTGRQGRDRKRMEQEAACEVCTCMYDEGGGGDEF